MKEGAPFNPEYYNTDNEANVSIEKEKQLTVREQYFKGVEQMFKDELNNRSPKIPGKDRVVEDVKDAEGQIVARYDKVRDFKHENRTETLWVVVDFDDVINNTTTFKYALRDHLRETLNISDEEFEQLYSESKVENQQGKKVLHYEIFAEKLDEKVPGAKKEMTKFFGSTDYNRYVNQAVKRALQGINREPDTRLSILTFGNIDYQRYRIQATDLDDIVDDIIYTEGSKKDALQALTEKLYSSKKEGSFAARPKIITIDDSPTHIEEYDGLSQERNYINIQFSHPQAKHHGKEANAEYVVVDEETERNQAAVNLWKATKIATGYSGQQNKRDQLAHLLQDPRKYDDILFGSSHHHIDREVVYSVDGKGHIIRSAKRQNYKFENYPEDFAGGPNVVEDWGVLTEDGRLEGGDRVGTDPRNSAYADMEEYIKNAP